MLLRLIGQRRRLLSSAAAFSQGRRYPSSSQGIAAPLSPFTFIHAHGVLAAILSAASLPADEITSTRFTPPSRRSPRLQRRHLLCRTVPQLSLPASLHPVPRGSTSIVSRLRPSPGSLSCNSGSPASGSTPRSSHPTPAVMKADRRHSISRGGWGMPKLLRLRRERWISSFGSYLATDAGAATTAISQFRSIVVFCIRNQRPVAKGPNSSSQCTAS